MPAHFFLSAIVAISLAVPQAASQAAPQAALRKQSDNLFAQIYKRGLVQQRAMQSIRARFTETTTSSLLVKPIVAHGTVIAASPARVRMTYTEPEPKTIVMDGRSLTIVWAQRSERERIDMTAIQKRIDQYFTHASIDELRGLFEITAEPDQTMRRADRVDMKPKRKQIRQGLERLELWIDRESDLLVQMRLTFPGGDQKTIALEDIAINVPVSDDTFHVAP